MNNPLSFIFGMVLTVLALIGACVVLENMFKGFNHIAFVQDFPAFAVGVLVGALGALITAMLEEAL